MNQTLRLSAYAKINLTLAVTGKREDGYHTLSSVMQRVSLHDSLQLQISDGDGVYLKTNLPYLPTDERNLCVKAARLYLETASLVYRVDMQMNKRIPVAAGLGGGSADAAAVLAGLESVFHVYGDQLPQLALKLGADVPFCLHGGVCLCEGIGEVLTPLESAARGMAVVVAKNAKGLSTPYIYQRFDTLPPQEIRSSDGMKEALKSGDIQAVAKAMFNDLELVSLGEKPEIAVLKEKMMETGAVGVMMSGSGPSVFGLYENEAASRAAVYSLRELGVTAHFATFI